MIQETLLTYDTAKLAQEKGFTLQTVGSHVYNYFEDNGELGYISWGHLNLDKPTKCPQSLLAKWLREVHNIEVLVTIFPKQMREKLNKKKYCGYILNEDWNPTVPSKGTFCDTYEEAFELGLQEALNKIEI